MPSAVCTAHDWHLKVTYTIMKRTETRGGYNGLFQQCSKIHWVFLSFAMKYFILQYKYLVLVQPSMSVRSHSSLQLHTTMQ